MQHMFLSNVANRQTNERGQTHLTPTLSELIKDCTQGVTLYYTVDAKTQSIAWQSYL